MDGVGGEGQEAVVAQVTVEKRPGGKLYATINAPNEHIAEFQRLVLTTAAATWVRDDKGVYSTSFGDSPICYAEVKKVVYSSSKFKAYFKGPQASLWDLAFHEQLKRSINGKRNDLMRYHNRVSPGLYDIPEGAKQSSYEEATRCCQSAVVWKASPFGIKYQQLQQSMPIIVKAGPGTTAHAARLAVSTALPSSGAATVPTATAPPQSTLKLASSTPVVAKAVPGPKPKRTVLPATAVAQTLAGSMRNPCGPSSSRTGTLPALAPTTVNTPITDEQCITFAKAFLAAHPGAKVTDILSVEIPVAGTISPLRSDSNGASDDLEVVEGLDSAVGPSKKRAATLPRKSTCGTLAIKENITPAARSPQAKRSRRDTGKNSKALLL